MGEQTGLTDKERWILSRARRILKDFPEWSKERALSLATELYAKEVRPSVGVAQSKTDSAKRIARATRPTEKSPSKPLKSENKPEVRLKSRRGLRQSLERFCVNCRKRSDQTWRYAESNLGPVFICRDCKAEVFDRSFGSKDALDHAVSGGAWEQNRRKH